MRRPLPFVSSLLFRLLNDFQIRFGVGELIDLFDLQAPIFVGDDVYDVDRLANGAYTV